jgi:RNA polymerase sigma factor (sigma-70 family)
LSDAELLSEFTGSGSQEAFRELVGRYSGLVYSACIRRLGNAHDAEDAVQAVFLTLARKAGSVRPAALASWLHRAATFVSLRKARDRALREKREREVVDVQAAHSDEDAARVWSDLSPALDGAVRSLPARYRDVVVMHYLAGRSVTEVAEELGKPAGTVKSLLHRALERLRLRLGPAAGARLGAGALAALLSARAVEAVPAGLVESTAAMAAGAAAVTPSAAALAEGLARGLAWAKVKLVTAVVCATAAISGGGAVVAARLAPRAGSGVLRPDPAVMRILGSLPAGGAAYLPPVRTAGDLNAEARKWGLHLTGPCGRNFGVKGVWMPDRERMIFAGANTNTPHRLNDVWEYDLPSNTWICLYGPDGSKDWRNADWSDSRIVDGVLRTRRGGPAIIGQEWWHVTYDPGLGAMLFMNVWHSVGKTVKARYIETGLHDHQPPLWAFYPESRRWEPIRGREPRAPEGVGGGCFDYVPELGGSVWAHGGHDRSGLWVYHSADGRWESVLDKRGLPRERGDFPGINGVAAWCPELEVLVLTIGDPAKGNCRTWHFSAAQRGWRKALEGSGPGGSPSFTPFACDTNAGVCLLFDIREESFGLQAYDPGSEKWTRLEPDGPPPPGDGPKPIAYYDPERNVFVVNRGEVVWVYRHSVSSR